MTDTVDQLDLFTYSARTTDPSTSHAAAVANSAARGRPRDRIVELLDLLGEATDYQLSEYLGMLRGTVAKRRGECVELGWVERAGRGVTDTGSPAFTWRLTDSGRARLDDLRRADRAR